MRQLSSNCRPAPDAGSLDSKVEAFPELMKWEVKKVVASKLSLRFRDNETLVAFKRCPE